MATTQKYIIINRTDKVHECTNGDFPDLTDKLNAGKDIIVISLYSNTIKIPIKEELYGEIEWDWKDYDFPLEALE